MPSVASTSNRIISRALGRAATPCQAPLRIAFTKVHRGFASISSSSATAASASSSSAGIRRTRPHSAQPISANIRCQSTASTSTQTVPASSRPCPSCQSALPASIVPTCPSCSSIVPPPFDTTSFQLFNLEPKYEIDLPQLKRTFLTYQQKVHPDLFAGQGDKEAWAKVWSGRVNDEYKTLVDKRRRGEYLVSRHYVTDRYDSSACGSHPCLLRSQLQLSQVELGEAEAVTDPELLMAIMETREALEDAQTEEEVAQIRSDNQNQMDETFQRLSQAFEDAQNPDLGQAKNAIIKLKYLENVENVCREWAPGKPIEIQHQ
ncbi:BZ3500_MvSof-1268-A1-R1_Chr3-1g05948 [Microbotryum saponariae]|uniref:BZ3500_MvSof-1268-A1-R1_Chr3-1g05948 protein n=1 Tax=Microbotryum saponariae TaxID=289078 RepID=A0A2X0KYQ4_9BASI|nr:BZ3500_MvSof-1268-A1-R1_Chr3-1g05948 [Microbotryum saponariae]SDA05138.1 BZ3501_MvSof-1269-A2-R1_Chr3-1g05618 [Microbotryum saponariae]